MTCNKDLLRCSTCQYACHKHLLHITLIVLHTELFSFCSYMAELSYSKNKGGKNNQLKLNIVHYAVLFLCLTEVRTSITALIIMKRDYFLNS